MIICIGYTNYSLNNNYKLFDTTNKNRIYMNEYELINQIRNGLKVNNLKLDKNNRIIGNNIDIMRLYYDGIAKHIVIGEVLNKNNEVIGYDTVNSEGSILYLSKEDAKDAAKYGKVINMTYVKKGDFARLISRDDITTRVWTNTDDISRYKDMDTFWGMSTDIALKVFKANGFKIEYTKEYSYDRVYEKLNYKDHYHVRYYILYDNNKNIISFSENLDKPSKISDHGGHLVTQSLNKNTVGIHGSSGVDKSAYANLEYRYNTFDIREGVMKSYKEVISNQQPVPYILDDDKGFCYELNLHTKDIEYFRSMLTEKYFPDDDLKGFGFENYIFMLLEYKHFSKELQQIFSLIYKNIKDMFINEIVKDIVIYKQDTLVINKKNYNNMLMILKEIENKYNIHYNWKECIEKVFKERKQEKEQREKERQARIKERQAKIKEENKKAGSGGIFGIFNLFSPYND